MTRAAVKEYVDAVREKYHRVSKKEKGRILDEFVGLVGCHRKSAVRLLRYRNPARPPGNGQFGRQPK